MNPEATVKSILKTGVTTIQANTALIDKALRGSPDDLLTMVRAHFVDHPPEVVLGYQRQQGPFPCWAITLQGDNPAQDYLGLGEEVLGVDGEGDYDFLGAGEQIGKVRTSCVLGIIMYAESPDIASAYYRICRYILNTARRRLIELGLQEPQFSGAELAPDARYLPDNLFVRRLTLTCEIEEPWSEDDELASALEIVDERLSPSGTLGGLTHEDTGGGIHPYTEES